ncbi:hypothetical protein NQ314_017634 [Rhamnusium bicolor]|uniref:CCHC-type domain-containing protein n=1 Tax=Rhamnusium bicolor TaxID=1586634 RepID=A0AAV8WVA8_9CUCU|nr:hypothetical protein NQ314_017634 [Rhamnusium bicolor]
MQKKCVEETNLKEIYGRTLKASIAKENGRTAEFIRRKEYPNKTRCYECGEFGHLNEERVEVDEEEMLNDCETLSAAIALEQEKKELENYRYKVATGNYDEDEGNEQRSRKKIKKSDYFSDEEESD